MEQDHKRWETRRELIAEQLVALKPDVLALNEVCVPLQTARWVQGVAKDRMGIEYALVQQTKLNGLAGIEAEALLTRFPHHFLFRIVGDVVRILVVRHHVQLVNNVPPARCSTTCA